MSNISLQSLLEERELLQRKLDLVDLMIKEYSKDKNNDDDMIEVVEQKTKYTYQSIESSMSKDVDYGDFPINSTWLNQLLYLLDEKSRFLSNTEIAELLMPYYPGKNVDRLKRRVSVVISDAFVNKKVEGLIKLKVSTLAKDTVWGYDKWLDDNGDIKTENKPFKR